MKHNDKKVKNEKIKKPSFAKANFLKTNEYLNDFDWDNCEKKHKPYSSWQIASQVYELSPQAQAQLQQPGKTRET